MMLRPAKNHYKSNGVPVMFHGRPWNKDKVNASMKRAHNKSATEDIEFLCEDFVDMIDKDQWLILPCEEVQDLPGLYLSPPGGISQRNRHHRWIEDDTWSEVNQDTVPLAPMYVIHYGRGLDRILREILVSNLIYSPVQMTKTNLCHRLYCINLRIEDIPKLALLFPAVLSMPPKVALPLCLPMGWHLLPPHFCNITKAIADITNERTNQDSNEQKLHKLDGRVHVSEERR